MFLTTGNAMEALVDAVLPVLKGDATLVALLSGSGAVYTKVPQAQRTAHPYIRLSDPTKDDDFGGMGISGGRVTFELDTWGSKPHTVHAVLARAAVVLERRELTLIGHALAGGSLHCTESRVFDETDPDKPEDALYHGHQTWEGLVEEL